ncbi:MAG: tRNA (adenosine(37)-N6)-dimethylallyltransferase MiaA [Cyclobacteriaceae bacterium]|nr:tRNA (adenosine(37)-N6)-dimethylallyltransferase MiaA [Cyclobacteriaceae bacterium SS2]
MERPMKLLVSIVGPTAVGKTSFAIELAKRYRTEIVSVDSRQFYREMEIGTAKPSHDELGQVKHHFINSHSIKEDISAGLFEKLALAKLDELFEKQEIVIAVGGSGLYFQALWVGMNEIPGIDQTVREKLQQEYEKKGLDPLLDELERSDPDYYSRVDKKNPQRIMRALEVIRGTGKAYSSFRDQTDQVKRSFENLKIGLTLDRTVLYERIDRRMDVMIEEGLFDEAKELLKYRVHNALQTVGYREIFQFLDGDYDREEAIRLLKRNSRRYAKRQFTWFNRDSEINWMTPSQIEEAIQLINKQLSI